MISSKQQNVKQEDFTELKRFEFILNSKAKRTTALPLSH